MRGNICIIQKEGDLWLIVKESTEKLSDAQKWIKDNGEEGKVYRIATMSKSLEITRVTKTTITEKGEKEPESTEPHDL